MTALALSPAVKQTVDGYTEQARALAAAAQSLQIRNATEAQLATEFLARAARIKRDNETARVEQTKPLNDQVKAINAAFKGEPVRLLEQADRLVRERMTAWNVEQQRLRDLEQQRMEAERRERERRAEADRQRAAAEADRLRREAEDAERRRLAELAAAQDVLAQKVATWSDEELADVADHAGADAELRDAARGELVVRGMRRAHEALVAEAQAAADAAHVAQLQAQTTEATVPVAAGPTRSTSGSSSMRRRWVAEVTDPALVPREYLVVDQRLLNQAVRDGTREIPGVRIYEKAELSVRAGA